MLRPWAVAGLGLLLALTTVVVTTRATLASPVSVSSGHQWADVRRDWWVDSSGRLDLGLRGSWRSVPGRSGPGHAGLAIRFGPGGIARAPDRRSLDPGRDAFAVAVVFRMPSGTLAFTGTDSPNLVQKGRYGSSHQWKLQLSQADGGRVQCRMSGSRGAVMLTSSLPGLALDTAWHTAACARFDDRVVLAVDGMVSVQSVRVGRIRTTAPVTVGNHAPRSPSDQFRGVVDTVAVARGAHPLRTVLAQVR